MSETFIAAMVQTRTRLSPDENVKDISALIREAKAKGASYVQTPEMTNLLAANREQLFKTIADEDNDTSLKSFRALARELKIYLHIGSMAIKATPDRAANRAFLIDPNGEIVTRYDKIHMFDVNLANGESYREFEQLPARRHRFARRSAVGADRADDLLRHALSFALPGAGGERCELPHHAVRLHQADRRSALARTAALTRDRERRLCVRRGTGRRA